MPNTILTGADYYTIGGYILLMIFVGYRCRNISSDISDYIRMGGKSTWWITGLSVFMASFSAATFTGYAAQAYLAGWSFIWNYWLVALMFFVQAALFAPLMRNTRAVTPLDAIRMRFGGTVEQIVVYVGLLAAFVWSGVFLWTLATFTATVFGLPITPVILVVGLVLVFYSVSGGSWSVQITDCLQSFLLLPLVTLMAILAVHHIGGFSALLDAINTQGLQSDFALLKQANHEYSSSAAAVKPMFYTLPWLGAMTLMTIMNSVNVTTSYRYLSIKTGRDAQKAALLAGVLMLFGALIWGLPAMVARLCFADAVQALPMKYPADGAYAVVAMHLLPKGLLGLVVVAMFSATMSSMDSNLTGTAGQLVRNLYQPMVRSFGWHMPGERALMQLTKVINLLLGLWAVVAALLFSKYGSQFGIFGAMQEVLITVALPMSIPFALTFLVRRMPPWGPVVGMAASFSAVMVLKFWGTALFGYDPLWHERIYIVCAAAIIPTLATRLFWNKISPAGQQQSDEFFKLIHTPVRSLEEEGENVDDAQLKMVGELGLIMAVIIFPLFFTVEGLTGLLSVGLLFGVVTAISGVMYAKGRHSGNLSESVHKNRI